MSSENRVQENKMASMEDIISSIKTLDSSELFKLLKVAINEAEKKSKESIKVISKSVSVKKTGSMPKGQVPQQLKKPRAWVEFTLKNALENGWESFTILQKKKDKEANIITEEQIEMPSSMIHNGTHIYKDSITDVHPSGRQIIHKEAMSLSKQRKESGHPSYKEFESSYVDDRTDNENSDSSTSKRIVIKKTIAEKEAEKKAEKDVKIKEKEVKKAEKAEKAEKAKKTSEKVTEVSESLNVAEEDDMKDRKESDRKESDRKDSDRKTVVKKKNIRKID